MTLLDAYALVALLGDEPAAAEVHELLTRGDCALTSVNLAEAVDVGQRVHGVAVDVIRRFVEPILGSWLVVLAPSAEQAWRAGELRATYFPQRGSSLSLADCFLLAAAGPGDRVATPDPPVARAARAEGIELVALPDRRGRRP